MNASQKTNEVAFSTVAQVAYHLSILVMIAAGIVRSRHPRLESDRALGVVVAALVIIALLPPRPYASDPLCSIASIFEIVERTVRAIVFSCVYVTLVYAAAPVSSSLSDVVSCPKYNTYLHLDNFGVLSWCSVLLLQIVCDLRSGSASLWVLGSHMYVLPIALIQIAMAIYSSFTTNAHEYEVHCKQLSTRNSSGMVH